MMKATTLVLAATALLITGSDAIQLYKRDGPAAVVPLTIHRKSVENPFQRDQLRRRQTVSETLDNFEEGSLYFANVTIGTPPQNFRFHIDTGSSDLWTNAASSALCQQGNNVDPNSGDIPCSVSGTYSANDSSTYKYIDSDFSISYADTTGASGDYVSDILHIGGKDVNPIQFGVGYVSNSSEGVMGIGYPSLEVQVQVDNAKSYPNIPQAMTSQGLIQSPAYSLWLDDLESATGSILFGGVDTDKYQGTLATLPIIQEQGMYVEMIVAMSGVSLVANGTNTTLLSNTTPVLLDSGSTLSYLPVDFSGSLYKALGVVFDQQSQQPFCSCTLANQSYTIDFVFSGQLISVPISEMVLEGGLNQQLDCSFGIVAQPDEGAVGTSYTLGDTFIRSAYIVYDLGNNQISLAQTNFKPSGSNIMEIGTGANAVPSASGVTNPASATVTGSAVIGGVTATGSGAGVNPTATSAAGFVPRAEIGTWAAFAGAALFFAL